MMKQFKVMFAALVLVAACSAYAYNTEIVEQSTRKIDGTTYIIDDLVNFTSSNNAKLSPEIKAEFVRSRNNVLGAVKRIRRFNAQNELVSSEYFDKDGKQLGYAITYAEPIASANDDKGVILP